MNQQASVAVVELAKRLFQLVQQLEPGWLRVFFRFSAVDDQYGSTASYVVGSKAVLIDAIRNSPFYRAMNSQCLELFRLLDKEGGVLLLAAASDFKYEIKFDFEDMDRWKISLMDGGTGIPADY